MRRSVTFQLFKITQQINCKESLVKNCRFKIKSNIIREETEAVNNIILVKTGTIIDDNNVESDETFSSRLVCLEVFDNTAICFGKNLTDKHAMICFVGINNQNES